MKFPTKIPEKSLRYAAFILTLSLILIIPTAGAQDAQTEKDSLQAYEIPYLVGAAQELTVNAINDLNGLKRNISEDVKGQLMRYIFGAFEEEGSASIQSDLKYDVPPSTLRRRSPITLAKYSSDFETEFEIAEISVDINSFRFTFPESPGPGTYEIYGSYEQYIKDEQGDTLNSNAQEKLVKYIAKRDPVSGKLDVKIISIAFSDPDKMPEFMEEEELKMLSQQYLKWRREGSPLDNLQVMSSEAVLETYNVVQKKRAEKSRSFANTVDKCMKAQARGDIKVAAESFIQAEKMQRSHPFVLSEKDDIRSALTAEIENTDKRTRQAFEAGNYVEADKLITANAGLIDLWSNLNNRRYDDAKKVLELQEEIRNKKEAWQDQLRRIENPTYRKQLQSDLKAQTENKACTGNNDAEDRALAEKLTLLAMIERIEPSGRNSNPQGLLLNALKCNSSFAPAKEELLKINEGDPQKAISFLNDLIYFEPENPHYFFERGRKHFLQGNTEDAQKDFIKTIENDPNNTATRLALAKVDLQKMRYDEAIEQLNILKGISESPETDILKAYAYLERDGHESKEAADQSNGNSPEALLIKGRIHRDRRHFAESKKSLYDLIQIRDDYRSNFELAETFFAEGREYVVARVYFQKALDKMARQAPKSEEYITHLRLCQCFREEKEIKQSLDHCKQAIKAQSKKGEAYYERGLTYASSEKKSDRKKASASLEDAQKRGFDFYLASTAQVSAYMNMGNHKKADAEFDKLTTQVPGELTAADYADRAEIKLYMDDLDAVSTSLQTAVSRNNEFESTYRYALLQGFLALKKFKNSGSSPEYRKKYLSEAGEHFSNAIDRNVTGAEGYLGMSMFKYYNGEIENAKDELFKSIRHEINNKDIEGDRIFRSYFTERYVKKPLKNRSYI
ncbi:MAG: hypothetical protein LC670_10375 [Flavobacteriales bacterium]|nr:hypothetical protein [Flavobacteriales bacterium]